MRELAQREAVGALLCLMRPLLLLIAQGLAELSAEAVFGGDLQRHAGAVMAKLWGSALRGCGPLGGRR